VTDASSFPPERPPGPPSIASAAARAGVSIATLSRVVDRVADKASPQTAARVRQAIPDLGYRPMSAGRDLRQRSSRVVASLTSNLANPAMAAIAAAAEGTMRADGRVMLLCGTHDQPDPQDEYLLALRAQRARAMVPLGAVAGPVLARSQRERDPLVFVGRRSPHGEAPFVGCDDSPLDDWVAPWLTSVRVACDRSRAPSARRRPRKGDWTRSCRIALCRAAK